MNHLYKYLVLASLLSGCAERGGENLINSLNHRYEYDKVSGENDYLYKALSLIGLLPTQKLGAPYYFSSQEGMDASFEVGGEKTLFMSQTIGDNVTSADVQEVSQRILELRRMSNKALHAKLNLIKAQKDKDTTLESEYFITYQAAREDLDKAHRSVLSALKPGIVILQWGNFDKDQTSFTFPSSNFQSKYNDKFKGLLVLGGIKISKLSSIGKDFCSRLAAITENKDFCSLKKNIVIPTYLLQTRHLVFMDQLNDVEKESVDVALKKAVESNTLSNLEKIEIDYLHQQTYSLFNLGEFSGMRTTVESNIGFNESSQWIPIYAVLPSARNLSLKLKNWCP